MEKTCYAVKNGRIPGIYYSWDETLKQINGFKNQKYKKFNNELDAMRWIEDEKIKEKKQFKQSKKRIEEMKELVKNGDAQNIICIDGAMSKKHSIVGSGILIVNEKCEVRSITIACDEIPNSGDHIFGELKAAMEGIKYMYFMLNITEFTIVYDYKGIRALLSLSEDEIPEWEADNEYSKAYKKYVENLVNKYDLLIHFRHDKSHTGHIGNELADTLANEGIKYHKIIREANYIV